MAFRIAPRKRSKFVGALLWLLCLPGFLMVRALFWASDAGERLNKHLGDWSWQDVVGSIIVFPIAFLIFVACYLGFERIAVLVGIAHKVVS